MVGVSFTTRYFPEFWVRPATWGAIRSASLRGTQATPDYSNAVSQTFIITKWECLHSWLVIIGSFAYHATSLGLGSLSLSPPSLVRSDVETPWLNVTQTVSSLSVLSGPGGAWSKHRTSVGDTQPFYKEGGTRGAGGRRRGRDRLEWITWKSSLAVRYHPASIWRCTGKEGNSLNSLIKHYFENTWHLLSMTPAAARSLLW